MDKIIFCPGNNRYLVCQGVSFLTTELGITLKACNPFDKYVLYSERLKSIPETIPTERRIQLAESGYYASGLSRSLRCFCCHSLAKVELVKEVSVAPSNLHCDTISCDYHKLAVENADSENITCNICEQKYKYGYVILKCGHGVYCYKCLYTTLNCPYNCGVIKGFARGYIN